MADYARCFKHGKLYPDDHAMCSDCAWEIVAEQRRRAEEYRKQEGKPKEESTSADWPPPTDYRDD